MTDLGDLNHFLGVPSRTPQMGYFCPNGSMQSIFFSGLAWLSVTQPRHLLALQAKLSATDGAPVADVAAYRSLTAYSDVDWAGCPDSRRFTSGYCVFLGGNLSSKRQTIRSTAEAEYRAVAHAVAECCWLRQLLQELHISIPSATIVYCDNVSAVYMTANPVHHRRMKHIEIDIHFVREKLFGAMREAKEQLVSIQDIQPVVFGALLHFIYTDSLPHMGGREGDGNNKDMLQHLLVAADRYAVERMKVVCESMLCKDLDAENVSNILAIAYQHNCDRLKDVRIDKPCHIVFCY
ncbi:LOW QUALITY PROTEIN: hypothetical protein U9M48_040363 [Paspalum notatum var. saurae]|uniref:BTB domain-containing protein n=1 Tax=Paspalum notatum var. saurae TaxID=547442 RepID=A0AAQ3XCB6_PASNO